MAKKRAAKNRQRATCYGGAVAAPPENIVPDLSQKGKVREILARETGITPWEARSVISVVEIHDRKLEDLIIEKQRAAQNRQRATRYGGALGAQRENPENISRKSHIRSLGNL